MDLIHTCSLLFELQFVLRQSMVKTNQFEKYLVQNKWLISNSVQKHQIEQSLSFWYTEVKIPIKIHQQL
jgi:hypothetical protein